MYYEFYTNEMMAEYKKALEIAAQYRVNSDRIKRLLSLDPVTVGNGQILVAKNRTNILGHKSSILINAMDGYINPALVA